MGTLDTFLAEMAAAQPHSTAVEELRPIFHKLEFGDDPAAVALHDAVVVAVGQKQRPLLARLADVVRLFERAVAAR